MSALASLLIWKLLLLFVSLTILRQAVSHFAGPVQKFKFGRSGRINLHVGARANRTRMTLIERIEADLFGFYPR
jgi:hypothetical protein